MANVARLDDVGVKFKVPRHTRYGAKPRLLPTRRAPIWGLRHASLQLESGQKIGLVGPNGSGKTTLLKTLARIYRPDEGSAVIRGRVAPVLSISGGLKPGLSGWENIRLSGTLLGIAPTRLREISDDVVELAGLEEFIDAEVRVYSEGMRARLAFSVAALSHPDLLILDEVMTVVDRHHRERWLTVIERLPERGTAVVLATHDLDLIARTCHRCVRLVEGTIADEGSPDEVIYRYTTSDG